MKHTEVTDDWLYEQMPRVDEIMIGELERQAYVEMLSQKMK